MASWELKCKCAVCFVSHAVTGSKSFCDYLHCETRSHITRTFKYWVNTVTCSEVQSIGPNISQYCVFLVCIYMIIRWALLTLVYIQFRLSEVKHFCQWAVISRIKLSKKSNNFQGLKLWPRRAFIIDTLFVFFDHFLKVLAYMPWRNGRMHFLQGLCLLCGYH